MYSHVNVHTYTNSCKHLLLLRLNVSSGMGMHKAVELTVDAMHALMYAMYTPTHALMLECFHAHAHGDGVYCGCHVCTRYARTHTHMHLPKAMPLAVAFLLTLLDYEGGHFSCGCDLLARCWVSHDVQAP